MDLPQPPQDQELKNIIDKLAQFVARNGPEFEQMTKSKQKDNPKFSFLFCGEYFNYYQFKVTTEQAVIKHRQQQQHQLPSVPPTNANPPQNYPPPIAAYPTPSQYPNYSFPPNNQQPTNPYQQQQQQQQQNNPYQQQPQNPYTSNNNNPYNNPNNYGPPGDAPGGGGGYNGPPLPSNAPPPPSSRYGEGGRGGRMPPDIPLPPGTGGGYRDGVGDLGGYRDPYGAGGPPGEGVQDISMPSVPPPPSISDNYQSMGSSINTSVITTATAAMNVSLPPPSSIDCSGGAPPPPGDSAAAVVTASTTTAIDSILQQQRTLQEQIKQSEHNLNAQHQVLQQQKETQVKEGIYVARGEVLKSEADNLNLVASQLSDLLTTITESCTKDSISAGKLWIFTNASDDTRSNWIAQFLCYKTTCYSSPFTHKLHIIYLMNDVLHSCVRKGNVELKERLQTVLVPMFCHAITVAPEDKKSKLDKLLSLWEGKLELEDNILSKLYHPIESWKMVEEGYINDFPQVTHTITHHLDTTFEGYKQQHNAFVQHAASQLQQLEQQKLNMEQQQAAAVAAAALASQQQLHPPPTTAAPVELCLPPPTFGQPNTTPQVPPMIDFSKPPPGFNLPQGALVNPDAMTHLPPPPGGVEAPKENLIPSVPYFELPAGLMCPMVSDSDHKYKPIDPSLLRLPAPAPPSERLLRAVENFYLPPSHDRPRNSEGWEQLSLYDYYKNKSESVKQKQDDIETGLRDKSPSPERVVILPPPADSELKHDGNCRRYRSKSPEVKPVEETTNGDNNNGDSYGRSPARSGRDPYSPSSSDRRSPPSSRHYSPGRRPSPPSYSSRRSPPSRRSPQSYRRGGYFNNSPPRRSGRSRSKSPVDRVPFKRSISRSPSPPRFAGMGSGQNYSPGEQRLNESNKGHQMLRKMGWGGSGLGLKEQGIENPIDAGDVREGPQERFRGLGIPTAKNDPYEAFRKNKGKAFINRMKARAEDKN